jgi:hypothetical protein
MPFKDCLDFSQFKNLIFLSSSKSIKKQQQQLNIMQPLLLLFSVELSIHMGLVTTREGPQLM